MAVLSSTQMADALADNSIGAITAAKMREIVVDTLDTRIDSAPRGVLAYAQATTSQSGISTVATVTGLEVSGVTLEPNRYIRISGQVRIFQRTSAGTVTGFINTDTPSTNTSIGLFANHTLAADGRALARGEVIITSSTGGSRNFRLRLSTSAATVDTTAGASNPNYILVEDIGAST